MKTVSEKRFTISEASEQTEVPTYLLRQWETRFPQLRPRRTRAGRRYYTQHDIDIILRIKFLLRHEKMTTEGARLRLAQELHGEGRPRTNKEALALVDRIEGEARAMLDRLEGLGIRG